jgi:hypothetical protein
MRTEFIVEHDSESGVLSEMYEALIERVVDLELRDGRAMYPTEGVYVIRVDNDGDVVICERDDAGVPMEHATFAIPQDEIYRVRIALGSFA